MQEQEIIKSNKLIAEFIKGVNEDGGYNFGNSDIEYFKYLPSKWYDENCLAFNTSWKWLMPVVEKIESIYDEFHGYFGVHISSNSCCIQGTKLNLKDKHYAYFVNTVAKNKIEATYISIIHFIKWYELCQKEK